MANDALLYPQDFSLDACVIITATGKPTDFRDVMLSFNYYEDIYGNFITGDITINDSVGFLANMSFDGTDFLILSFSKPSVEQTNITKTFRIYKVSDRHPTKDQNENYKLHFCSEEAVLNEQYKVSKSYKNQKISDIVKDIVYNQLKVDPKKFLNENLEVTSGVREIIIPNFKPFEALNWLATQAISGNSRYPGASYLFYENLNGYNFKSLQALYDIPPVAAFKYEPKNLNSADDTRLQDLNVEIKNVIGYDMIENWDYLNMVSTGAFANRLIAIDLLRLRYTVNDFDYLQYFNSSVNMNPYPFLTGAQNRFKDTYNKTFDAMLKVTTTNTGDSTYSSYIKSHQPSIKDINIETTVPYRSAQVPHINENKYRLTVPGDPLLTVGQVITFLLPEIVSQQIGQKNPDKYYSGNFLITAVRHRIDTENKFLTVLEISKESVPNAYVEPNNSLAAWQNVRSK